jgi:hypothetical protein
MESDKYSDKNRFQFSCLFVLSRIRQIKNYKLTNCSDRGEHTAALTLATQRPDAQLSLAGPTTRDTKWLGHSN